VYKIKTNINVNMVKEKSLFLTYLLWLFFGWFGLHHFYLRRDRQAFIWWSTFGGYFLLGWIRDIWRIPEYVDDVNEETHYIKLLTDKIKNRKNPQFNIVRFGGQLMVGYFYGMLVRLAIPEECPEWLISILVCTGVTMGVYLVGNIGREKGPFKLTFLATIIVYIAVYFLTEDEPGSMYCTLAAACTFNWFRQYRQQYTHTSFCKRVFVMSVAILLICSLWLSFLYFNAEITTEDGEKIKIRDSVNHFFKSPAWLEFKETISTLYQEMRKQGWQNIYDEFIKALDPKGEANARKVLGVNENTPEKEIKQIYKKLVRQWHPDRYRGDNKRDAEKKFMEIQEAYDILTSKKKSHTVNANERSDF